MGAACTFDFLISRLGTLPLVQFQDRRHPAQCSWGPCQLPGCAWRRGAGEVEAPVPQPLPEVSSGPEPPTSARPPREVRSGGKPGLERPPGREGGGKTWRRIRHVRQDPARRLGSRGHGSQVEMPARSVVLATEGRPGTLGGRFRCPSPAAAGRAMAATVSWLPRPRRRWRCVPALPPPRLSPAVARAGEAGRAGSRGGTARGRRLRGAGGGGGGRRRRAGRRAGEEEEERAPCRTQLQAGQPGR